MEGESLCKYANRRFLRVTMVNCEDDNKSQVKFQSTFRLRLRANKWFEKQDNRDSGSRRRQIVYLSRDFTLSYTYTHTLGGLYQVEQTFVELQMLFKWGNSSVFSCLRSWANNNSGHSDLKTRSLYNVVLCMLSYCTVLINAS